MPDGTLREIDHIASKAVGPSRGTTEVPQGQVRYAIMLIAMAPSPQSERTSRLPVYIAEAQM